jgi:hypothetical protein
LPSALDILALLDPCGHDEVAHFHLSLKIADDDEIPRLHEAHRRRVMRGEEEPRQDFIGYRIFSETASYITPREDGAIDGGAGRFLKVR